MKRGRGGVFLYLTLNLSVQNHLDLFPAERMVYLSPDSNNDLQKFNPDDIYVIGGIIDKGNDR